MTYESETQLLKHGYKPLRDLPNRAGFEFIGITRALTEVKCWVVFTNGMHMVNGHAWGDLIAWK